MTNWPVLELLQEAQMLLNFIITRQAQAGKKGGLRKEALNMYLKEGLDESYSYAGFTI